MQQPKYVSRQDDNEMISPTINGALSSTPSIPRDNMNNNPYIIMLPFNSIGSVHMTMLYG